MKNVLFVLIALCALVSTAHAQLSVYGRVYDEDGVLGWSIVRCVGIGISDTACPFGNWYLNELPVQDSVQLEVWHQGYIRQTCWAKPGACNFWLEKLPAEQVEQRGDFNLNGEVTAADIIGMVSQVFQGQPGALWPEAADFNCNGEITAADIIGAINHVFRAGAASTCGGLIRPLFPYDVTPAGC
jgi:hypothetical protein